MMTNYKKRIVMKIVSYNIAKRMKNLAEKEMPYFTKLFGFKAF